MSEYRILGWVIKNRSRDDANTQNFSDQFLGENLRIELWDRDQRFNDRLGAAATLATGFFEIRFTDDALRRDPEERETLEESEFFFKAFRGDRLLFSTELFSLDTPDQQQLVLQVVEEAADGEAYSVFLTVEEIVSTAGIREEAEPTPLVQTVVDVLPTTDQVVGYGRASAIAPTENRSGSLQQTINNAFSRVLGHTFTGDVMTFRNSLDRSFTAQELNGRTNYIWQPRTYSTQTELGGALTGAQASLYHRAKVALKEILPLLDGLEPLDPAADEQNREAVRAIIRTEVVELVNEMGVHQGPRVQRVNSLFNLLIGSADATTLPEQVGGQLKDLVDTFGLSRARINTVDEERNFSNYLIIRDYLVSLRESWRDYTEDSGSGAYIGTQLVLLSQALSVVSESVRETYRIMDSVFLGYEERQSVWLDFTTARAVGVPANIAFPLPDGTGYSIADTAQLLPRMDVERLLSWVMRFSTEEGPVLARSSGKLGIVSAIADTAERLMILVQAASYTSVGNSAFRREGVIRALRDLAFQLYQVQRLAKELIPPIISGTPDDVSDRPRRLPNNGSDNIPPGVSRLT